MKNYKGLAYPIQKTTQGFFHGGDDISQIKASFLTIIMTRPGERVFEPFFGTPLHLLDASKPPEILEEECRAMIAKALNTWEKRFPVSEITAKAFGYDINITIKFIDPANLRQEHVLTLQMPLSGGIYE
jgi:phage baseplate assembly protein W